MVAAVPLAVVLTAGCLALYQAYMGQVALARVEQADSLLRNGYVLEPQHAPVQSPAPPFAILTDALLRARVAQAMPRNNPTRARLLNEADAQLGDIASARPMWGEYWVVRAYVATLRQGERSSPALTALSRSYRETPYLPDSLEWRTTYALRNWDLLPADVQQRAVRETVWLARRDYSDRDRIIPLMRTLPAYRAFMVEWLETRRLDRDFAPVESLTP